MTHHNKYYGAARDSQQGSAFGAGSRSAPVGADPGAESPEIHLSHLLIELQKILFVQNVLINDFDRPTLSEHEEIAS